MRLYNKVRIPVYPIYGGFPVKFRTYLGKPIEYDESLTPQDLQVKVSAVRLSVCPRVVYSFLSLMAKLGITAL